MTSRTAWLGVVVLVLQLPAVVAGQSSQTQSPPQRDHKPEATAVVTLRGRVLAADTRLPLAFARVTLEGDNTRQTAKTDAAGVFAFGELAPGRYHVDASKTGYVMARWVFGWRRTVAAKAVQLDASAGTHDVELLLPRGGVISGRVADVDGGPAIDVRIEVLRRVFVNGRPEFAIAANGLTDDRGEYRVHGLAADTYVVSTARTFPTAGDGLGYAPLFYPGTTDSTDAQRIRLRAGQEAAGIDLTLTGARRPRVSGTAYDTKGNPLAVGLVSICWDNVCPLATASNKPAGQFELRDVPTGRYVLNASGRTDAGERETATALIEVGLQDVTNVVAVAARPSTLTGQIVFEGEAPKYQPGSVQLVARQVSPRISQDRSITATVKSDWSFTVANLAGPRVFRAAALPEGWALKSVALDDRDVTDTPVSFVRGQDVKGLRVTLTRQTTTLRATVSNSSGAAIAEAQLVVFAADSALWTEGSRFIATTRPGPSGEARIDGLPPGEYLVVAVDALEEGQEQNADFLNSVKRTAVPVTLKPGETARVSVGLEQQR